MPGSRYTSSYFLIIILIFIIPNQDISFLTMDVIIDFTKEPQPKLTDLSQYSYLRSVTFVLPFFQESKKNLSILWEFISFLNDKPLVKIFVKPKAEDFKPKYKVVAVGGTFDHLHIGHQVLLLHAVLSAQQKLIVGITSEEMLKGKANKEVIQSLLMRINEVRQFLKTVKPDLELQFVELNDPYGPTIEDENIDAIVVSAETLKMAEIINEKRKQKGFHGMEIQNCPIMAPVHHLTSIKQIENKISSTQIRAHILSKNGFTIQQFTKYQSFWRKMIDRINKVTGQDPKKNYLISSKWWDIVVKHFSQYWRYYHTNRHNANMLRELTQTPQIQFQNLTQSDQIVLEISIFFHDIIYRPDLQTNQEDSSKFAEAFINQIWGEGDPQQKKSIVDKVKSAILSTKSHKPSTQVEKILCDLDMSILDSPLQQYQEYAFNIEREYRPQYFEDYPKERMYYLEKEIGKYKFTWRKGDRVESNLKWEIEYWRKSLDEEK